jgi:hypothetical protein
VSHRPKFTDLPFIKTYIKREDMGRIEMQWEQLCQVKWQLYDENNKQINSEFWCDRVRNYTNAGGDHVFQE